MFEPIVTGEVSPDTDFWYQIDYYDRSSGYWPWMVSICDDLHLAFQCYNYAQKLAKGFESCQRQNLYLVRRDGTYQCLRSNSPDEHMRTIEPFGTRTLVALYQLRTAGACRG